MKLSPDASNFEIIDHYKNSWFEELDNIKKSPKVDTNLNNKLRILNEDHKKYIKKFDNIFYSFSTDDIKNIEHLKSIYEGLNFIYQQLQSNEVNLDLIDNCINNLSNIFNSLNFLPTIIIRKNEILSEKQIITIKSELNNSLDGVINVNTYNESNSRSKTVLSKSIVNIWNLIIEPKDNQQDLILEHETITDELDKIQLKKQIDEIKDSHAILTQFKENQSIKITGDLNNGYTEESNNIKDEIKKINKYIIYSFIGIFTIIVFKIITILYFDVNDKSIYIFISYMTLLISLSALITYFIKDRNKLIVLKTHYEMNVLELSTLPKYMSELDSDQRKQMFIDLSNNYFRGSNRIAESSENISSSEIEGITKSISDLTNLVSEIKGAIK